MTEEKNECVPRLRFPEFENLNLWQLYKISDIIYLEYGKSQSLCNLSNGNIPIVGSCGIMGYNDNSLTDGPSLIIGRKGNVGKIIYLESPSYPIDTTYYVHTKNKDIVIRFLFYTFLTLNLDRLKTESAIPGLNRDDIYHISICLPSIKEQQKITACLSSLDELIEAREQKCNALKQYKKGLMQRLFPAEGETTPRWRFPEFRDSGEWRKIKLEKLLIHSPDYGVNAPAIPYSPDLPTYIRITDISDNGTFIKEKKMSVNIRAQENNYLHTNDIVLARTGASVGKAYKYCETDGRLIFAGFLIRISPDTDKVISTYLFYFLFTEEYWRWVQLTSMRSGQPGINGTEYASLPIPLPSLPEQQKIADCLSSLDDRIAAEEERLAALREHKKGLMQQLFPRYE